MKTISDTLAGDVFKLRRFKFQDKSRVELGNFDLESVGKSASSSALWQVDIKISNNASSAKKFLQARFDLVALLIASEEQKRHFWSVPEVQLAPFMSIASIANKAWIILPTKLKTTIFLQICISTPLNFTRVMDSHSKPPLIWKKRRSTEKALSLPFLFLKQKKEKLFFV